MYTHYPDQISSTLYPILYRNIQPDGVEPELAQLIERGVEESINFVLESYFKTQIGR